MNKTITAYFDSVDMAINAARKIRQKVKDIEDIKVATKNDEMSMQDNSILYSNLFTSTAPLNGVVINEIIPQTIPPAFYLSQHIEETNNEHVKTRLEIIADENVCKNICSKLRNSGGTEIKII